MILESKSIEILDSITTAKAMALEFELRPDMYTEEGIQETVDLMNYKLFNSGENERVLLGASNAYVIPSYELEFELLPDSEIRDSWVENPIIKAKIDCIGWVGSTAFSGFGLRMFGVDFLRPKRHHTETAFVLLDDLGVKLAV